MEFYNPFVRSVLMRLHLDLCFECICRCVYNTIEKNNTALCVHGGFMTLLDERDRNSSRRIVLSIDYYVLLNNIHTLQPTASIAVRFRLFFFFIHVIV